MRRGIGMHRSRVGSPADRPGVIECCWRCGAWSMSALACIADSSRTSREVRKVPQADIISILTVRTLGRCKPVAQSLTEAAVPDAG
jgi:hypothetical protein